MNDAPAYHILYLDDEADNLSSFRAVFRRFYHIATAQHSTEALALLEAQPFDLVLSDQRMPGMTGVEFLEIVHQRHPECLRMIVTGYSDMQAVIDAINKGKVYHYISKPWQFDALKLVLDKALETHTLRLRNQQLEQERTALLLRHVQQEKAQLLSQYEALRHQVDPHFLFNSLNTLASLIAVDPARATRFTTQFARLYRSILELGEEPLIPLQRERELVDTYMYLQGIRFGEHLRLEWGSLPARALVLPFALQVLVENAIKHNTISAARPLRIHIGEEDGRLVVRNPLQPRPQAEPSTRIGLSNLAQRYALITGQGIQHGPENGTFCVRLPLVWES